MLLVVAARFFLLRDAGFETTDHKEPSIRVSFLADYIARTACKIARQLATCGCQALGSSACRGPSNDDLAWEMSIYTYIYIYMQYKT